FEQSDNLAFEFFGGEGGVYFHGGISGGQFRFQDIFDLGGDLDQSTQNLVVQGKKHLQMILDFQLNHAGGVRVELFRPGVIHDRDMAFGMFERISSGPEHRLD